MKVKGWFEVELIRDGETIAKRKTKNTITNVGKAEIANLIGNVSSPTAFTFLGVGVGTAAAAATDTTLGSEIVDTGLARAAATMSRVTTTTTNDTVQLLKAWTATGVKAVTECGFFNAVTVGILGGRQVFTAVNTANGDILQITYKIQLT